MTAQQLGLRDRLRGHVELLAGVIGERHVWKPGALEGTAKYIEKTLAEFGHGVEPQFYEVAGVQVRNLEVELKGRDRPEEILIVGAHYDSVQHCPAANDSGSGVAALLELARWVRKPLSRTVRFVAFVNEEPPFFQTERMGSRVYARRRKQRKEKLIGMISLETIGYYTDEPASQTYPLPGASLVYPAVGNYIAWVSNLASGKFLRQCIGSFRTYAEFPSEAAALPGQITGVGWSDQWSFWQEDYPGVMVTDTAPFRYPHYHTSRDTPEKLAYDRMARVVDGIVKVVQDLAG